jgi:hypothetical protein
MSHMSQDCLCTRMHTRKRCGGEATEHVRGGASIRLRESIRVRVSQRRRAFALQPRVPRPRHALPRVQLRTLCSSLEHLGLEPLSTTKVCRLTNDKVVLEPFRESFAHLQALDFLVCEPTTSFPHTELHGSGSFQHLLCHLSPTNHTRTRTDRHTHTHHVSHSQG